MQKSTEIIESLIKNSQQDKFIITANGSSMFPTIILGDRIYLKKIKSENLNINDVILCKGISGRFYLHRVIQINPVVTKGDSVIGYDEEIKDVLAIVEKVEKTWHSILRRYKIFLKRGFDGVIKKSTSK